MSYNVFPGLQGLTWPMPKKPAWATTVQKTNAGNEFRTQTRVFPISSFDLSYAYMSLSDKLTMEGFFNGQAGKAIPFYFDALNDDTISAGSPYAFASTDGVTQTWPLYKPAGNGASEPIGGINGTPVIYLDGSAIPAAGFSAPGSPSLGSSAGGSLGATTYYVKVTWQTPWGETVASAEVSLAVAANHVLTVTSPGSNPPGVTFMNVYVSNTAGGGSGHETLQASISPSGTWTEPTSGLVAGVSPPVSNTTGWSIDATNNGITTGAVCNASHVLSWTGSYYYLVRFDVDELDFEQMLNLMYQVQECPLVVVR